MIHTLFEFKVLGPTHNFIGTYHCTITLKSMGVDDLLHFFSLLPVHPETGHDHRVSTLAEEQVLLVLCLHYDRHLLPVGIKGHSLHNPESLKGLWPTQLNRNLVSFPFDKVEVEEVHALEESKLI